MVTMTTTQSKTAQKPAAKKATPAKTAAKRPAAPKGGRFNAADLPTEGTGQYRKQGEGYVVPLRALGTFAKADEKTKAHFKALTHLGWVKVGGVNAKSESPAFKTANEAGLAAEYWTVDGPAATQIAANMTALAEAGAPEDVLNDLWAAYVGSNSVL
jgi:hypothetical protein